ncbi:MAG: RluA family pseudouridine synthase [Thermoguttaceae bacterium]|nr:RluA family pseudouridine synthase [Thermoguttaceae bacterium]MDW8078832.1 RluA family pseudouridine synthase [Thermoguttaceae bacterium]
MDVPPFEILYEDQDLIAVNKPAGMPTMGVGDDRRTVIGLLRLFLEQREKAQASPFLGVVSRLDTPVTGLLVFAKSRQAAASLCKQFRERKVDKRYWAIIERKPEPSFGTWRDWLVLDRRHRKVKRGSPDDPVAVEAITRYESLGPVGRWYLVELSPLTGRKHQLRWQLSLHGHPVLGDRKYGSQVDFPVGIALHARRLQFSHPRTGKRIVISAPVPPVWRRLGVKDE